MNALEEHLLEQYPEPELPEDGSETTAQQFSLTNDQMANWALRKVAKIRAEFLADAAMAETELQRISTWLTERQKKAQRSEEFFTSLLTVYFAPLHEADPKVKTFSLPAGKVQFRAQQPSFTRDDVTLVYWLKEHDLADYVKVVESPEWGELKKVLVVANGKAALKDTGEILDGVTVEERAEIVRVEVS